MRVALRRLVGRETAHKTSGRWPRTVFFTTILGLVLCASGVLAQQPVPDRPGADFLPPVGEESETEETPSEEAAAAES